MKKLILNSLLSIIGSIGNTIGGVWAVVSFIIYLVKDVPFNWYSIVLIVVSTFLTLLGAVLIGLQTAKEEKRDAEIMKSKGYRSKFQMRLDEAMKKQEL